MLATLIPLFDGQMAVHGYSILSQRENYFLDTMHGGSSKHDNAMQIEGFEILESMGISTLTDDKTVFVPLSNVSLFSDIAAQCGEEPKEKVVLLFDRSVTPEERYVKRLEELKEQGFLLAASKIPLTQMGDYRDILLQSDYILLNHRRVDIRTAKGLFTRIYPNLRLCATDVESQDEYDMLKNIGGFDLYDGPFFRMPVSDGSGEIAPFKANYLDLLRMVNVVDFDFVDVAEVIGRDTALVASLLGMVNRMTVRSDITSVRHAAAMLGQVELKKWINAIVTKELCSDKPSEITRLSLLRGKFAENLADSFGLKNYTSELLLMGMFSVLDIILDKPMDVALSTVSISPLITEALLHGTGTLAPVISFIKLYEQADWQEVSRILLLQNLDMDKVYDAYLKALKWYRDMIIATSGVERNAAG